MRAYLLGVVLLCLSSGTWAALAQESATATETVTWTPTATWTTTSTWTPTATWTATATWTPTPTWTATWTPVVQTVIVTQPALPPVVITQAPVIVTTAPVSSPAVTSAPPNTPLPQPTQLTPFYGWQRFQSIHFIAVIGTWGIENELTASARQYRTSSSRGAIARYPFTGDGVQLAYHEHPQGCVFDILVDNLHLATINSFAEEPAWAMAGPFFLSSGYHVFDIRSQAQESGICAVSFDYIDVFFGPPIPAAAQATIASIPTQMPAQDVARVVLLSAPPTALPSPTPVPVSVVSVNTQLSYDSNANGTADLGEGVRGVSVRVVNATTGELLQSGFTDERGTIRFQVITPEEIMIHIPLLARSLLIRPAQGRSSEQKWEILLPPANQPAVIP
jgi:hypothetical protein